MRSIRLTYDAEGDILDVDFRLTGDKPKRGIELHDNIMLWTDVDQTTPFRLMLLSYSRLLEQPGLLLKNLKNLPSHQQTQVLHLLTREPLNRLLTCIDEKDLRFQVIEPKVKDLAAA